MNQRKISIHSYKVFLVIILTVIITLILVCIIINVSLDNENLRQKYSLYHSQLVNHSSLASRLKLQAIAWPNVGDYSNENIENILTKLFIEHSIEFKIKYSSSNFISVEIEKMKFSKFIDIIYLLVRNEMVEISDVDMEFDKNNGDMNGKITFLSKLS